MNHIVVTQQNGFQIIEMRWSPQRPGFHTDTFDIAANAIREADHTSTISCNVVLGAPRCFCFGADATSFAEREGLNELSESSLGFFSALINSKKPLIAGVDGIAAGVGMTMLLHFDVVFATPSSTFKAPFVEWGLVPDAGSTVMLPALLGYQRSFELLCLGGEVKAAEALQRGLITRIVPAEDIESAAMDAAGYLAGLPPRALRTTRELLRQGRMRLIRQARTENGLFKELLDDQATQRRLRVMGRAVKMALSSQATKANTELAA
jgi:enoyl-CoA hydratase/carnithine racemase